MERNTKQVAKNTLYLYIRSAIVLIVSLYTSRVVLNALGVEDFGLYNVIGGVVALFSFMRTSLTKATQRFLNTEMATGGAKLNDYFVTSLNVHIVISIVAVILLESIGLWFLNMKIQIPEGREFAAIIVYQTTVVSLVLTIVSTPYTAAIISHEQMSYFAIVSVINALLKLLIAVLLLGYNHDSLILYSVLMLVVTLIDFLLYYVYCKKKYYETNYKKYYNKEDTKELLGYTSWTIVGQFAIVGTNQGNNILVNLFHSVTANAAMGVASQVNSALVTLTNNFQTAFNPQITKAYATKDYDYLNKLINYTCKFSYVILIVFSLPIVFNIDPILHLWLGNVPRYSNTMCVLMICNSIINALSAPLNFTVLSSKNIKNFQIVTSIVYLLDLPLVYLAFKLGFDPTAALFVKVFIMILVLLVRLVFCSRAIEGLNIILFVINVFMRLLLATMIAVVANYFCLQLTSSLFGRVAVSLLLFFFSCVIFLYIGMCRSEREMIINLIKTLLSTKKSI